MPQKIRLKKLGEHVPDLKDIERSLRKKGYRYIAGVDEAGRGPLAGPVVAAAVILPPDLVLEGLDDSKKLNPALREELFEKIVSSEAGYGIGVLDNNAIDASNILRASIMAMARAVRSLTIKPDFIIIDGLYTIPNLAAPQLAVVDGDECCPSISAASIVAKVTRDRIMDRYQELFPQYSFSSHRGYATPQHLEELRLHGPTDIHRKTFHPVFDMLNKSLFDEI